MIKVKFSVLLVFLLGFIGVDFAQEANVSGMLDTNFEEQQDAPESSRVTAVYGISADDYLPAKTKAVLRKELRPDVRGARSRPAFDLPDAFYFIGGPIFLLLFLRVLVIFLNGFEEKRREELRAVASESANPTKSRYL